MRKCNASSKYVILFFAFFECFTSLKSQVSIDSFVAIYDTFPIATRNFIDRRRARAGFNDQIEHTIFLSKTSFFTNKRWNTKSGFTPRKNFGLDAYINPYISISSDRWTLPAKNEKYWMFALFLNPNFEVRILRDDPSVGDLSEPVRTPSYRPGGELFISKSSWYKNNNSSYAMSIKGFHHSNGQDGVPINQFDRPWGKQGYYNTYNGDFSDDFVWELNGLYFKQYDSSQIFFFAKLGASTSTWISSGLKENKLYGTQRINFLSSFIYAPKHAFLIYDRLTDRKDVISQKNNVENFRVEFFLSYIVNRMNTGPVSDLKPAGIVDRLNFHITFHKSLTGFSEAGLFAEAGYYGQDTYNAYLQRSAWFLKAGISFGKFIFPKKSDNVKKS